MPLNSNIDLSNYRIFLYIVAVVLIGFLCVSFISANLWHFLPGFNDLKTTFSLPIIYQLIILGAFIFTTIYYVSVFLHKGIPRKKFLLVLIVSLLSFLAAFFSTYNFTVSHRSNSISSSIGPFPINNVSFSDDLRIKKILLGYQLSNSKKSVYYLTDMFFLGTQSYEINQKFVDLGECIQESQYLCLDIDVSWP